VVESKECILTEFVLGKLRLFTLIQVVRNTDLPYDILVGRDIICHGQEVQFAKESGLKLTAVEQVGFSVTDIDPDQEQMSNLLKCYEEYFAEDWQVQKDDGGYRGIHYECHLGPKVSSAVCQREMMNTVIFSLWLWGFCRKVSKIIAVRTFNCFHLAISIVISPFINRCGVVLLFLHTLCRSQIFQGH